MHQQTRLGPVVRAPKTSPQSFRQRVRRVLMEIYLGDQLETTEDPGCQTRRSPIHSNEDGKITLITTVTLMFFLVLICYIANIGNSIRQKMELQNAADSAAYSIALWQARGMNATTVSNHMLGEASALIVMVESLGGRIQTEKGKDYYSSDSQKYNTQIEFLKVGAPNPALAAIDRKIIDNVSKLLTEGLGGHEKGGKHSVGATIFDGKMTLKYSYTLSLIVKNACTAGILAVRLIPPLVWIEIPLTAIDIAITLTMVAKIAQEFAFLEGLQVVSGLLAKGLPAIEKALIPAVSIYGATAAGHSPLAPGGPISSGETTVNRAAAETLERLNEAWAGQKIELEMVPDVAQMTLPLAAEKEPKTSSSSAGSWDMPESLWDGPNDRFFESKLMEELQKFHRSVDKVLGGGVRFIGVLIDAISLIPGLGSGELGEAREKLNDALDKLSLLPQQPDYRNGCPENPCHHESSQWKLAKFDWQAERKSQWVRGTFPYVESYREPMIRWMQTGTGPLDLELCNAATYYTHWTNRYTLAKSWEIRSNYGQGAGRLTPRMFVLKESSPDKKGYEAWTDDDDKAEELFVVYGVAFRPAAKAHFGAPLFPKSNSEGAIAISAAMIYNANGRNVPAQNPTNSLKQLNNGWDTLNWLPPVAANEWGGQRPRNDVDGNPWHVLKGDLKANRNSQVQINWQAKLVPLTVNPDGPQKLEKSVNLSGSKLDAEVKELIIEGLKRPELITH